MNPVTDNFNANTAEEKYLFTSNRLGFRNWQTTDLDLLHAINTDREVMKFFPGVYSYQKSLDFIARMQKQFLENKFCYFAVDQLINNEFIGFIGLSVQTFTSDFTPCTDIGWRLKKSAWNIGFATEGAIKCLEYAFQQDGIDKVIAIAPKINLASEKVMIRAGMQMVQYFKHPLLSAHKHLEECVLYEKLKLL